MIVIDCSLVISSLMPDENSRYADAVFQNLMKKQVKGIVPSIFYVECMNVLETLYRKQRVTKTLHEETIEMIGLLPLIVDLETNTFTGTKRLYPLMQAHQLTSYDASYLEIAQRRKIGLASLDKALQRAAIAEKVCYNI